MDAESVGFGGAEPEAADAEPADSEPVDTDFCSC